MEAVYEPGRWEEEIYRFWEEGGFFQAAADPDRPHFSLVIPPPNVTGVLHLGHALDNTLQDILARYHRMRGEDTLWLPGMDHAGIHTQMKVEAELREEGLDRHGLGREAFLSRVWDWKERYGGIILRQLRRLGVSVDWSRERFTLDEERSRAVREVFVRLYEEGLIYRGDYITNWCPSCRTALSDIEVEHQDEKGRLHYVHYPLAEGEGGLVVATTRPETMLGDVGVAVHPDDERYRALIGKELRLPLLDRLIPVVADEAVDPAFGTGAVKVTPAHDPTDFGIGERHGLTPLRVIGEDGRMLAEAGPYAGLDRYEARQAVLRDLEAQGLLLEIREHDHAVGHCQKCDSVIEPLLSRQWFVRMRPLAEPALAAVREGRTRFIPDRFAKVYEHWLENIKDWCISRQIWWGHRIPAWYCQDCGEVIVAREAPDRCPKCDRDRLAQDPDVLDTWFSSALWPFSTLGWPDDTADLRAFFPTSVLVTGYDIIFFWVARMLMQSLHFLDEVPFRRVLIHGIVRDEQGRKMSKSLGNGVDPLEVIEQYGADALRLALIVGTTAGNDLRYHQEKVIEARNFTNKIWNAVRFGGMNLADLPDVAPADPELPDRWIQSRLAATAAEVGLRVEEFELGEAARLAQDFFWGELCDWYLEAVKPRLRAEAEPARRRRAQETLGLVLERGLRILHPFVPFVSEAAWRFLPHQGETLSLQAWPVGEQDLAVEDDFALFQETVQSLRNLKASVEMPPKERPTVTILASGDTLARLRPQEGLLRELSRIGSIDWVEPTAERPEKALSARVRDAEVFLPLAGLSFLEEERERLQKEIQKLTGEIERTREKLSRPGFRDRAPQAVVAKEGERLADFEGRLQKAQSRLGALL